MSLGRDRASSRDGARRRLPAPSTRALTLAVIGWLVLSYSLLLLPDRVVEQVVASEQGVVENVGALAFLGASLLFAVAYAHSRRLAFLVLALAFFVGAGEELSWGKHWFGFATPEGIEQMNAQGEVTIHNLDLIQDKRNELGFDVTLAAFISIAFAYTVLVPALAARSAAARRILSPRLPLVQAVFGALFVANLALFALAGALVSPEQSHAVTEVAEAGFAVLFLGIAWDAAKMPLPRATAGPAARPAA